MLSREEKAKQIIQATQEAKTVLMKTWRMNENGEPLLSFNPISEPQLQDKDFDAQSWAVENLIPSQAMTILAGKSASFKTYIGLHMAVCISEGMKLFGKIPTEAARVLYIDEETGEAEIQNRIRMIEAGMGIHPRSLNNLFFLSFSGVKIGDTDFQDSIKEFSAGLPMVVIIDTIRRVMGNVEENAADAINQFYNEAIKPMLGLGLTVVCIHHHRKGNGEGEDQLDLIRGSSEFGNTPDSIITMRKSKEDPRMVIISHPKNRRGVPTEDFMVEAAFTDDSVSFNYQGEPEECINHVERCAGAIKKWCETESKFGFLRSEVEDAMKSKDYHPKTIGRALNVLLGNYLIKPEKGKFVVLSRPDTISVEMSNSTKKVTLIPDGTMDYHSSSPFVPSFSDIKGHNGLPSQSHQSIQSHDLRELIKSIVDSFQSNDEQNYQDILSLSGIQIYPENPHGIIQLMLKDGSLLESPKGHLRVNRS